MNILRQHACKQTAGGLYDSGFVTPVECPNATFSYVTMLFIV